MPCPIYGHGCRNCRDSQTAAVIAEGRRRGIPVSVQARKYSIQRIEAAARELWRQQTTGVWSGFKISTIEAVGAVEDGLTVNGEYTTTATTMTTAARAVQSQTLPTTVDGIPVRIKPTKAAVSHAARNTDFAPFYGGSYMISPTTNGTCSAGFGIRIGNVARITTARHCWPDDYQARDATNQYGADINTSHGARALTANGGSFIYRGAWDSTKISAVANLAPIAINDYVCTGGGNSGEHCNIKVTNMYVFWDDGFSMFRTIRGDQQTSGAITSIQGDSGGPVFALTNAPAGKVRAVGMIQAGTGTILEGNSCGNVRDTGVPIRGGSPFTCSTSVLFSPFSAILTAFGATLLTA